MKVKHNFVFIAPYFPGTKLELFRKDIRSLTNIRDNYFICGDLYSEHRFWNFILEQIKLVI